jgi:excisionase family DNA binding protein
MTPELFTITDFVNHFRVSRSSLYRLIASGDIQARKVGRRTMIARVDAERWIDSLPGTRTASSAA